MKKVIHNITAELCDAVQFVNMFIELDKEFLGEDAYIDVDKNVAYCIKKSKGNRYSRLRNTYFYNKNTKTVQQIKITNWILKDEKNNFFILTDSQFRNNYNLFIPISTGISITPDFNQNKQYDNIYVPFSTISTTLNPTPTVTTSSEPNGSPYSDNRDVKND